MHSQIERHFWQKKSNRLKVCSNLCLAKQPIGWGTRTRDKSHFMNSLDCMDLLDFKGTALLIGTQQTALNHGTKKVCLKRLDIYKYYIAQCR